MKKLAFLQVPWNQTSWPFNLGQGETIKETLGKLQAVMFAVVAVAVAVAAFVVVVVLLLLLLLLLWWWRG